jgi:uncharacterized protein (TIGR00296 family)
MNKSEEDLRGCIGTFQAELLDKLVGKYALISALEDDRFEPISLKEVQLLNCAVSLLTNFEPAQNALDWEVGKHGIEINFKYKNKEYGSTFLPEVAPEQGWDQKTTLQYLVRKSGKKNENNIGYKGKIEEIFNDIKTTRYQSKKDKITFEQYKELRKGSEIAALI